MGFGKGLAALSHTVSLGGQVPPNTKKHKVPHAGGSSKGGPLDSGPSELRLWPWAWTTKVEVGLGMMVRAFCLPEEAGELFHLFALCWGAPLGLGTCTAA